MIRTIFFSGMLLILALFKSTARRILWVGGLWFPHRPCWEQSSEDGRKVLKPAGSWRSKNKEILPGSCWDYANPLWPCGIHMRENGKKFQKRKSRSVYRCYRSKTRLVILCYSFLRRYWAQRDLRWTGSIMKTNSHWCWASGESRHEPARYLPYDCPAYMELHGQIQIGAAKAVTKTTTPHLNIFCRSSAVTNKNAGSSTIKTSSSTNRLRLRDEDSGISEIPGRSLQYE